ncbi:nitroreductase family protein [Streptomyces malaysiense]|uniref:Nitroreductase n=1 Tax=Streptomyces malaysiense TaxID=1428626 RepID=A0A1J4PT72_9ACTN|nr:nitroreductase family protein [Streptomyces malaysiense]OIK23175.1 nitroreductase [Streptomyces malaysiense]
MVQSSVRPSGTGSTSPEPRKSPLRRVKARLQFTGWLQYVLDAVPSLAFCLVAAAGRAIGALQGIRFWLPAGVALLLFVVFVFDLVTVKFGLRPAEALPGRRDGLGAFDLMRARRSCRSFQSRDLTADHRAELLEAVRSYTTPGRLIGGRPVRFEYVAASLTVWPVVGAHEFLVAIAPRTYDRMAVVDVGRSLQHVVLHATRMGLATCWIGPGADQKSIVEHLGDRFDPEKDHVICVCAVGYRSSFKPLALRGMQLIQRRRLPLTSLFFADPSFRKPLDVTRPPWATYGRSYEVCQWAPSSFNSQTTRCVAVADRSTGAERPARFDFYASTGSRYYAAVALGIWCANWETGCRALGLDGHFAVLTPEERRVRGLPGLPRYDVSWVVGRRGTE